MADPNQWPVFIWLALALGFGSVVSSLGVMVWKGLIRRRPGWVLDSVLLGASGFVLVLAMTVYLMISDAGIPKEMQRLIGYFVLIGFAVALVWVSREVRERMARSKKIQRWKR